MQNRRVDEDADYDEERGKDQKQNPADSHPDEVKERVIPTRKNTKRLKHKAINQIDDQAKAPSDQRIKQRLAQSAFTLHRGEGIGRSA